MSKSKIVLKGILSPRDAGRELGVSAARAVQLNREGLLPALRDSSGRRFFRAEDVAQLVRRRRAPRAGVADV